MFCMRSLTILCTMLFTTGHWLLQGIFIDPSEERLRQLGLTSNGQVLSASAHSKAHIAYYGVRFPKHFSYINHCSLCVDYFSTLPFVFTKTKVS